MYNYIGFEPATFRFVAQHLNHCATAVPSVTEKLNEVLVEMYFVLSRGSWRLTSHPLYAPLDHTQTFLHVSFFLTSSYNIGNRK